MSQYQEFKAKADAKLSELEVNPNTFCVYPFTHVSTMTHGEIKLCCRGQPPKNGKNPYVQNNFDLQEYWQGDYMNSVRESLVKGERINQCKNCWKMEDNNIQSLRQMATLDHLHKPQYKENVTQWLETGTVPFRIPLIELKLSNLCNFKCRMCWPKDSSLLWSDWDKIKHFYGDDAGYLDGVHDQAKGKRVFDMYTTNDKFMQDLSTLMKYVDQLEFAGGEPLLDPAHYDILEAVENPEQVTLKYSTNLSRLDAGGRSVLELWPRFKNVLLTISIDGDREGNTRIRRNSDWDTLAQNIRRVKQIPTVGKIKGTTCISAFNALDLDKTANAVIMELGIQWHTSRLQYPQFQHANVLPPKDLLLSIVRLEKFRDLLAVRPKQRWNILHVENAINWLRQCVESSKHTEESYNTFLDFNRTLDGA